MKDNNEIVSLDQFRNKKQEEKKRKTERIFFHHLVGAYAVIKPGKMIPVELIDISDEGLAIQTPYQSERSWAVADSNLPLRLYFSEDSFMEVNVSIKNARPTIDGGTRYLRYGCEVQKDQRAFDAWKQFVGFLRVYSEISEKDSGNIGVGNI